MYTLFFIAQLILPADFPGSNPTPHPPPHLAKVIAPDGSWNLHMIAHPEWDPALYADWLPQNPLPVNPSEIAFSSPDHAIVTDYEIGFFLTGASAPVQSVKLPKPALNADGDVHLTFNSRPLGLGLYEIRVRPYAGTVTIPWSGSAPFERAMSGIGPIRILR